MDNHDIIQHLLNLEAEAKTLVTGAQNEADGKISEGEKQNRALYNETFTREVKSLENSLTQNAAAVKEDYRKQLEAYRESLKTMNVNMEAFSRMAEKLLIFREA